MGTNQSKGKGNVSGKSPPSTPASPSDPQLKSMTPLRSSPTKKDKAKEKTPAKQDKEKATSPLKEEKKTPCKKEKKGKETLAKDTSEEEESEREEEGELAEDAECEKASVDSVELSNLGPKSLSAAAASSVKRPVEPFTCALCDISVQTETAMRTHLSSDWHRRAALSKLFFLKLEEKVYPRDAFLRLAQSPLVLNAAAPAIPILDCLRYPPSVIEEVKPRPILTLHPKSVNANDEQKPPKADKAKKDRPIKKLKGKKGEKKETAEEDVVIKVEKESEKKKGKEKEKSEKKPMVEAKKPGSYSQAVNPDALLASEVAALRLSEAEAEGEKENEGGATKHRVTITMESDSDLEEGEILEPPPKKAQFISDPDILARRQRDLNKAKDSHVYARYERAIPKSSRQRGIHPRTPNKYDNVSRRSWDAQVRLWKKSLHVWAGNVPEELPPPSPEPNADAASSSIPTITAHNLTR